MSFGYKRVGFKTLLITSFISSLLAFDSLIIFLIREKPFECGPLDSIPINTFPSETFSFLSILFSSIQPTANPARSKLFPT